MRDWLERFLADLAGERRASPHTLSAYRRDLDEFLSHWTTLGIPLGVGVIILAWLLTMIYVAWANRSHDAEVSKLRDKVKH